jgi:DNA-binding GntR family transcriptional regulator
MTRRSVDVALTGHHVSYIMSNVATAEPDATTADDLPSALVDRESIPDIVYETLRRDIAYGRYKPGVLRIRPLAERFGVSATPIREALRRLEAEGLVTLSNRRIMVRAVSADELCEIFAVRLVLESFAVSEAAKRPHDDEDMAQLEALLDEMDATAGRDPDRWRECNQEFHMRLYGMAGNARLLSMIDALWVAVEPYLRLYVHAVPGLAADQDDHRIIYAAVREGRADDAAEALRTHLATTRDVVQRGFAGDAADA